MEVSIKGTREPTVLKNGRYTKTFTPTTNEELIRILHNDCIGTNRITQIQIEKGRVGTDFVEPSSRKDEISGIYKDLRAINIQMQDPASDLWSKITANNKAMITEFEYGSMSSAIGQTADTIRQEIKDSLDGIESTFTQNVNGFQQRVTDESVSSAISQIKDLYDVTIRDIKGNYSHFTQTIDNFKTRIENAEENYSSAVQTINGMETRVKDDVAESVTTQLSSIYNRKLSTIEDDVSQVSQLATGLQTTVSGVNGLTSKVEQLANQITSKISGEDVDTIIGQSEEAIWLSIKDKVSKVASESKMTGDEIKTAINLSRNGVSISGSQISITGDTFIDRGVIKNAHLGTAVVNTAQIGTLDFSWARGKTLNANEINVTNINASNITTGKLSADRIGAGVISGKNGEWNLNTGRFYTGSYNSRSEVYGGAFTTYSEGLKTIEITGGGLEVYRKGIRTGQFISNVWESSKNNNFRIGHVSNTSMTLSYTETGATTGGQYIIFDKYDVSKQLRNTSFPIQFSENTLFNRETLFSNKTWFGENTYIMPRERGFYFATSGRDFTPLGGRLYFEDDMKINKNSKFWIGDKFIITDTLLNGKPAIEITMNGYGLGVSQNGIYFAQDGNWTKIH